MQHSLNQRFTVRPHEREPEQVADGEAETHGLGIALRSYAPQTGFDELFDLSPYDGYQYISLT